MEITAVKNEEVEETKITLKSNKKKNSGKNAVKCDNGDMPELLRGVQFSVARNGPDLYLKSMEKLQPRALTTYKNGAFMRKSLKQDKLICYDHSKGNVEDPCKQYHQT